MTPTSWPPVRVDPIELDDALRTCVEQRDSGRSVAVVGVNAAVVNLAVHDDTLRDHIAAADIAMADGIGVVLGYRALHVPIRKRVATPDFVDALLDHERGARVFLLGTTEQAVTLAGQNLRRDGIDVVGVLDGFFDDSDLDLVLKTVREAEADIVLVGTPSPRKEWVVSEMRDVLPHPVIAVGVGGYLDILAGTVSRAPRLVQTAGLEWAYRLSREPRRLARRYLVGNAQFLLLLLRWRISLGRQGSGT